MEPVKEQALKFDAGKAELSQLPREALEQIASVMMFGAKKYGKHNWRKGHDFSRLADACLRHVYAWLDGETNDPESGMNHLAHAGCCILFLLWASKHRPDLDDRPEPTPPGMLPHKESADRVAELMKRYQLPAEFVRVGSPVGKGVLDSGTHEVYVTPGGGLVGGSALPPEYRASPVGVPVADALVLTDTEALAPLSAKAANDRYAPAPGVVE